MDGGGTGRRALSDYHQEGRQRQHSKRGESVGVCHDQGLPSYDVSHCDDGLVLCREKIAYPMA
jgi:hypothetical protein